MLGQRQRYQRGQYSRGPLPIVDSVGEVAQEGDVVVGARAAGEDGAKDQGSDHVEGKQDQDDGADGAQADRAAVQQAGHVHWDRLVNFDAWDVFLYFLSDYMVSGHFFFIV